MRRMDASFKNARALRLRFSQSLARRRQRLSQAIVRSTIQRLGSCTNPLACADRLTISVSTQGRILASALPKSRPLIGAVGEQLLQEWKLTKQRRQQQDAAVAILNAGGMNDGVQQQTQRIDENMPFLALDQFARIKPVRIDVRPPFSALLTL